MVVQLHKVGDVFVLPPQAADALKLVEGATVDIQVVDAPSADVQYATEAEVMSAFEATLPQHEAAYRELAK